MRRVAFRDGATRAERDGAERNGAGGGNVLASVNFFNQMTASQSTPITQLSHITAFHVSEFQARLANWFLPVRRWTNRKVRVFSG